MQKELDSSNKLVYRKNYVGLYAWKLGNIVKYKKEDRISVNGKLGLWNYNDRG